jgi:DNA-directed RNA polymerase subunit RPC12/RpoP|tara:strand:+ start:1009 stop:1215 length:207 start_codon:yes stop_codon:yes gene_type:complete
MAKKKKNDDICTICKKDLNLNELQSKRIGMLDEKDELCGWVCPHCNSQFDLYDIVTNIYGEMKVEGEA